MKAARAGMDAARSTYRDEAQNTASGTFESYDSRLARYTLYRQYASNTVFNSLNANAELLKADANLYHFIRGIYNPTYRLIDIEIAKTYGGAIDWTGGLRIGAIPVVGADNDLVTAITTLLKWSNFGTAKSLYVRQGATTGDSFLHNVDDLYRKRIRMDVLDPAKVTAVTHDEVGNIKAITISYKDVDEKGKSFTRTLEIDGNEFRTFKDDKLFPFYKGINGEPISSWNNDYGFVPVRQTQHKDIGQRFAVPSFAQSLSKINELNDQASLLNDNIRKVVNATWAVIGGVLPKERQGNTGKRDQVLTINLPEGTDIKAMVMPLDIGGVIGAMKELMQEIENDMPQLALQGIRKVGGDASGVSIRNLYNDAVGLIEETQGNYDQGLIAAIQMGISMAASHKYDGFSPYTLESYNAGDLDFYLAPRPVFADSLSRREKIELLVQVADKPIASLAMREMGYSQDDIDEVEELKSRATRDAVRGLMDSALKDNQTDTQTPGATNGEDEDPDAAAAAEDA